MSRKIFCIANRGENKTKNSIAEGKAQRSKKTYLILGKTYLIDTSFWGKLIWLPLHIVGDNFFFKETTEQIQLKCLTRFIDFRTNLKKSKAFGLTPSVQPLEVSTAKKCCSQERTCACEILKWEIFIIWVATAWRRIFLQCSLQF